jgi:hypothetical protein
MASGVIGMQNCKVARANDSSFTIFVWGREQASERKEERGRKDGHTHGRVRTFTDIHTRTGTSTFGFGD